MKKVLETLAQDLLERGRLNLSECFIDGTFIATCSLKGLAGVSGETDVVALSLTGEESNNLKDNFENDNQNQTRVCRLCIAL